MNVREQAASSLQDRVPLAARGSGPGRLVARVDGRRVVDPAGQPVDDRDQALAVAKRLAIDIAETRNGFLGQGGISPLVKEKRRILRQA